MLPHYCEIVKLPGQLFFLAFADFWERRPVKSANTVGLIVLHFADLRKRQGFDGSRIPALTSD